MRIAEPCIIFPDLCILFVIVNMALVYYGVRYLKIFGYYFIIVYFFEAWEPDLSEMKAS